MIDTFCGQPEPEYEYVVKGRYGEALARIRELEAELTELKAEWEAVKYAAHMPGDYEFGLPTWINTRLYHAYIGAYFSDEVREMIESGRLRFPNSRVEKDRERLKEALARYGHHDPECNREVRENEGKCDCPCGYYAATTAKGRLGEVITHVTEEES